MTLSRRDFVAAVVAAGGAASVSKVARAASHDAAECNEAVYVIATVTVKEGKRDEVVRIFNGIVPDVHAEDGCIYYEPAVDIDSGIPAQPPLRPNVMVVVEKWDSLNHLHVHLDEPHMHTYREAVADLVEDVELLVMKRA